MKPAVILDRFQKEVPEELQNNNVAALREWTSKNTHSTAAKMLFNLPHGSKVLDIPCGEGAFTHRLQERGYTVISSDVENCCKAPNASFSQANMNQRLPWEDNSFDAIACIDGIEHLERPFDFIRECNRTVRPGGQIVI